MFATTSTLFRRSDPPEASRRARAAGPPSYWLSVPGLSGLGPMHRQPSGPRCDVGLRPTSARFAARGPARLSARSRCTLRSMPPIGRHHCALRSRRRPRARRLPMGRRPPAGRLSRRVVASLDCSQRSQSAGPRLSRRSRINPGSSTSRVASGVDARCAFVLTNAPSARSLRQMILPCGGFSAMRRRLPRKGKAAGPLHPAAFRNPYSMLRLAQRSISSSMLRTASFAAWMPSPFAMPAML